MTHSFRLSIYLDFYRFHRFISEKNICPSVNQKSKTGFMQTVNLLTIVVYQTINTIKKSLKNLISLLKLRLKSSSDG